MAKARCLQQSQDFCTVKKILTLRRLPQRRNRGLPLIERDRPAVDLVVLAHVGERIVGQVAEIIDVGSEDSLFVRSVCRHNVDERPDALDSPIVLVRLQELMFEKELKGKSASWYSR